MSQAEKECRATLRPLGLGGLRFFDSTNSSNDQALAWAACDTPDMSLVVADAQTRGRGRNGHTWFTPPGSSLAFSLVLRPSAQESQKLGRFAGLAALALLRALRDRGIVAQIKWPNDVLIDGKKTAGILIENVWLGNEIESLVLGMGINVSPAALPPAEMLNYEATCVQAAQPQVGIARFELLRELLLNLAALRPTMGSDEFLAEWEEALAFRGQTVRLWQDDQLPLCAQLLGLTADGGLRVRGADGELREIHFGEVHLRPL